MSILPIINTDRLILRKFEKDDSYYMFVNWGNDEECCKYTNMQISENENICENCINTWEKYYDKGLFMWAVCLKDNNEPIGMIGFELSEKPEISFTISIKHNNHGYATEALYAVLQYGAKNLEVRGFWGYHFIENYGAGKVMQKAGMIYKGSGIKFNKYFSKDMNILLSEHNRNHIILYGRRNKLWI